MNTYQKLDHEVNQIANTIKQQKPDLRISDLIDEEGHQYIDLVMEGGGMLGIALLGYISTLEKLNIRFRGIGGTSAGAITATLLAAVDSPKNAKCHILTQALFSKNFYDFVDGDSDAKDFINTMLNPPSGKFKNWKIAAKAVQIIDNIRDDLGLNPGDNFKNWIKELLDQHEITSVFKLKQHLSTPIPKLLNRDNKEVLPSLKIISADVSTCTKVEFPSMTELYWENDDISPAELVRASMSIPYFFKPYVVKNIPKNKKLLMKWQNFTAFHPSSLQDIPSNITFLDGGIMSNFPINLFHDTSRIPQAPTFGVKLGLDTKLNETDGALKLLGALFNSARYTLDFDFIKQNPDYRHLLSYIDIDETKYNWLDFNMPESVKKDLFMLGAEEAKKFILKFDWERYKKIREGITRATTQSNILDQQNNLPSYIASA